MSDVVAYLLGGLMYLVSPRYRRIKQKAWASQSVMFKIYEIGMWITIPSLLTWMLIVVWFTVADGRQPG